MKNIKQRDNALIKRRGLILELKKVNINRISPQALAKIEEFLRKELSLIAGIARQEMIINGRKNLKEADIIKASEKLVSKRSNSLEFEN